MKPEAQKHRLIPFHQREALEFELNKRLEQDIIEPVFGSLTEWLSQLVLFFKPDSSDLRICVDYRAIKRERHLLPTLEEIVMLVDDADWFTFLGLNSAFEQIGLAKECCPITTFGSHTGLYRSKRLNLSMCSAPEIFHNLIRKVLAGLKGVINAHDDILVYGEAIPILEANVDAELKRLKSSGLILNLKKCQFNQKEIEFFGLTFSKAAVSLKEVKASALRNTKRPRNRSELHSFLGLAVWCSKFIENFATVSAPL